MPDIESAFLHIIAASYPDGEVPMTDQQARDANAADDAAILARWHDQARREHEQATLRDMHAADFPELHTNPWDNRS
jgi:hypothetical protein